jgi:aerobic C4-dicarboxylate transport protein
MTAFEIGRSSSGTPAAHLAGVKSSSPGVPFYRKLYVQVLAAVVVGALLGYVAPNFSVGLKPFGDAFVKAIKVVVGPIIFTTIALGIAQMRDIRRVANVGVKALIYFEIASTLALIIGMIVGNVWQIGAGLNADPAAFDPKVVEHYASVAKNIGLQEFLLSIIPNSFVEPFVKGDIMPVLFVAVLLGFGLSLAQDRGRPVVVFLESASSALFAMVRIIMYCAPIAALCAIAFTVGK